MNLCLFVVDALWARSDSIKLVKVFRLDFFMCDPLVSETSTRSDA